MTYLSTPHPFLTVWAGCALVAFIATALAAAGQSRRLMAVRSPERRKGRRTARRGPSHAARGRIPRPRVAPDSTTTVRPGLTNPDHTHALHHAEEIRAVLGCTCSPSLGGTPTVNQTAITGPKRVQLVEDDHLHTGHVVTGEYEISYRVPASATKDAHTISMLFVGPSAEEDAYTVGDVLAESSIDHWTIRMRTVEKTTTYGPWIAVATFNTVTEQMKHQDYDPGAELPHRIEADGSCTACDIDRNRNRRIE